MVSPLENASRTELLRNNVSDDEILHNPKLT
jgi:hypothetical protein